MGKGSARRPSHVTMRQLHANWARTFGDTEGTLPRLPDLARQGRHPGHGPVPLVGCGCNRCEFVRLKQEIDAAIEEAG